VGRLLGCGVRISVGAAVCGLSEGSGDGSIVTRCLVGFGEGSLDVWCEGASISVVVSATVGAGVGREERGNLVGLGVRGILVGFLVDNATPGGPGGGIEDDTAGAESSALSSGTAGKGNSVGGRVGREERGNRVGFGVRGILVGFLVDNAAPSVPGKGLGDDAAGAELSDLSSRAAGSGDSVDGRVGRGERELRVLGFLVGGDARIRWRGLGKSSFSSVGVGRSSPESSFNSFTSSKRPIGRENEGVRSSVVEATSTPSGSNKGGDHAFIDIPSFPPASCATTHIIPGDQRKRKNAPSTIRINAASLLIL